MASRAHVIHDISFGSDARRPRRHVQFRVQDPIVLPRSSAWSTGAGLIAVTLAAGALVVGSAYAAFHSEPTALAETPPVSLERDWQPLLVDSRAKVTNLLSGPAFAVPAVVPSMPPGDVELDAPLMSSDAPQAAIDEPAAGTRQQRWPQATPRSLPDSPRALVPDPTTTPPDAIAPPDSAPEAPTPLFDSENPYR